MRTTFILASLALATPLLSPGPLFGERRQDGAGDQVKRALADKTAAFWIYEDVDAGIAQARRTGKPLLVSIR